ncbi:hypothetical protein CPJ18_04860 [Agrobacterium rosae]|uniref:Uncharacterized protein n=1 Tax=Agrobacterium rosae TaxID=1972867 RepID=A0AAE5VQY3_9HYPH|nr:hypothetical protein DXM21_09625 [Agrobacterium rosae]KAA3521293.1 hypothetical protein DXM25_08350 [Agrobacterium rosae]MQB48168.1 hypothetical protein [Agrobacterium rosae]POO53548.1 hypothetical protein CPJ18_04860 [Agrobacterium rosae]
MIYTKVKRQMMKGTIVKKILKISSSQYFIVQFLSEKNQYLNRNFCITTASQNAISILRIDAKDKLG